MPKPRKKLPSEGMTSPVWASTVAPQNFDVVASKVKEKLQSVRSGLEKDITSLVSRLGGSPLIFDENRLTIIKNFLLLSYLIGEVNILFATVWRYTFNDKAWNIIAPSLVEAIEDIEKMRENGESLIQSGAELTSFYLKGLMKNYHQFLIWFDSHLEDRVSEVTELTPLETRVIDILSCCPTVDFELTLTKPNRGSCYCGLTGSYKILNLQCVYGVPDFSNTSSTINSKESKLIKFLRDSVRYDNTVYLQNIINTLSVSECQLVVESDEKKLENMRNLCVNYERVLNELYQLPVHDSYTTTLGKTRFFHDIYKRQLRLDENVALVVNITVPVLSEKHLPLILNKPRTDTSTQESRKDALSSVSKLKEYSLCFGCSYKPEIKLNVIYNDGSSLIPSEILIIGGHDKNKIFISQNSKINGKDGSHSEYDAHI